MTPAQFVDQ